MPAGIILDTKLEMTSPTPAAVNTAPKAASNMGSMLNGPTTSIILRQSFKKTFGVFDFE